jgi:DNA-binding NarL/FixJ family response regulator
MIDVLLAVPHQVLAAGIQELLQRSADIRVLAKAATKQKAFALVEELHPHVVIWDFVTIDGYVSLDLEMLTRLTATNPQVSVLILGDFPLSYYDNRMRQVGAAAYLPKYELAYCLTEIVKAISPGDQQ